MWGYFVWAESFAFGRDGRLLVAGRTTAVLFLGIFGIHRFYTKHTTIGVVQLLTLGGCGVWALIDFILTVVGNYKDANGNPLRR